MKNLSRITSNNRRLILKYFLIFLATKSDLLNNPHKTSGELVAELEGELLAKHIQARKFVQCSVFEETNIDKVFEEAVKASIEVSCGDKDKNKVNKFCECNLM